MVFSLPGRGPFRPARPFLSSFADLSLSFADLIGESPSEHLLPPPASRGARPLPLDGHPRLALAPLVGGVRPHAPHPRPPTAQANVRRPPHTGPPDAAVSFPGLLGKVPGCFGEGLILGPGPSPSNIVQSISRGHLDGEGQPSVIRPSPFRSRRKAFSARPRGLELFRQEAASGFPLFEK